MGSVMGERMRELVAEKLQVNEFLLVDVLLDTATDYLVSLLGLDNADEAERFAAMPCFWVWFRQVWAINDMRFLNGLRSRPQLLTIMMHNGTGLEAYSKFHKAMLNDTRPVGEVMRVFGAMVYRDHVHRGNGNDPLRPKGHLPEGRTNCAVDC